MPNWNNSSSLRRLSRDQNKSLHFEVLEPRRVLATNLFVDFGEGFGPEGLTINDTESGSLGGPQIFGDGTDLGKFSHDVPIEGNDLTVYINHVMARLTEFYSPFDVNVQQVDATNIAEIEATLQSSATMDTYIYVGGNVDSITDDTGAAVIDPGNSMDNLAFVFTDNFDPYQLGARRSLAAYIAKQAAHTFGVNATEASVPKGDGNIMATPGTDTDGNLTGEGRVIAEGWGFIRADLDLKWADGISPGTENTFEALLMNVGASQTNSAVYFTTTGDSDSLTIEYAGINQVDITLDGTTIPNVDISGGLEIKTISGSGNPTHELNFRGINYFVVAQFDQLFVNNNIIVSKLFGDIIVSTSVFGDELQINNHVNVKEFRLGAGDDVIHMFDRVNMIQGEEGDDHFYANVAESTFISSYDAGPGFDTLDFTNHSKPGHNVSDITIWDVTDEGFTFGFEYNNPLFRPRQAGFDLVVGNRELDSGTDTRVTKGYCNYVDCVVPINSKHLTTVVNGDTTTITETSTGRVLMTERMDGFWGDDVYVHSTARPLTLFGGNVHIGSSMNLETSFLPEFEYDIQVVASTLIVANQAGSGLQFESRMVVPSAFFGSYSLPGGGALNYPGVYTPQGVPLGNLIVHGSDSDADVFRFGNVFERVTYGDLFITLNGHGGDDYFEFGSSLDEHSGILDMVMPPRVRFTANGGFGNDYLYMNDEEWDFSRPLILTDQVVQHDLEPPFRRMSDLHHDQMETVRVTLGDAFGHKVLVAPSPNTEFIVEAVKPQFGENSMALIGNVPTNRHYIERGVVGTGTWYFEDNARLVLFTGFTVQAQNQRLAIGTQEGSSPLVKVFEPQTGRFLFEIQPYEASFMNGIQVDTGDLNGDSFPEIIVAPGWGRLSEVKIYDGRQGDFLTSFFAFPADSSIPSENFTGGVDIVVGNLFGGRDLEIAASTLWGTSDVRIFRQVDPLDFELQFSYNPFPDDNVRGVRIAENQTQYHQGFNIVATTAPGNVPKVQIGKPGEDNGFIAYAPNYLGGFHVASGEIDGNYGRDVLVGGVNTGSVVDPFSGQFRVFARDQMPAAFEFSPEPRRIVQAFDRVFTRGVSLATFDFNLDGQTDVVFAAQSKTDNGSAGEIKSYRVIEDYAYIDSIFANHDWFDNGIELG